MARVAIRITIVPATWPLVAAAMRVAGPPSWRIFTSVRFNPRCLIAKSAAWSVDEP
jgi:hypothetical protein